MNRDRDRKTEGILYVHWRLLVVVVFLATACTSLESRIISSSVDLQRLYGWLYRPGYKKLHVEKNWRLIASTESERKLIYVLRLIPFPRQVKRIFY